MRLADCYRLLDLEPDASFDEVRRAYHDLTKVWHPDRFGHDVPLRRRAEEKLKAINEAFATIREAREGAGDRAHRGSREPGGWQVRTGGRELRLASLEDVARLAERGAIDESAELFDDTTMQWVPISTVPRLRESLALVRARKDRGWALTFGGLALLILLRRPTPGGLLIALVLGGIAVYFTFRERLRA
jgi:hypothetical protein